MTEEERQELARLREEVEAIKNFLWATIPTRPVLHQLKPFPKFPELTEAWDRLFGVIAAGTILAVGGTIDPPG